MTITKKPCPMCGSKMVYIDENGAIVKKKKTVLAENLGQILSDEGITVAMLAELRRVADVLRVSVEELRGSRNEGEGK
jgi:hypothetical protein